MVEKGTPILLKKIVRQPAFVWLPLPVADDFLSNEIVIIKEIALL